ncbi:hypothetical protein AQUCO_00100291v1 [Aquilegia coerulea]|uniref:BHLH domain-containing protein n=1 Tax=Aquilegia coerulea TaxID=218851 RepID=A0A2G5F9N9_AQUCA|nr:hypothetical protein AQUCO_00100291v1 [Aquilegia coerulea]
MEAQLDTFPFEEPRSPQADIISSWLDLDDVFFQQELQHSENHLVNLETDPIFSSLPIPEGSPFMLDTCNFNAEQAGLGSNDGHYQPIFLPAQQCVELDVHDTFLNDYDEFGLISPTDLSPDNNNINDEFCETTMSGIMNILDDVEMSEPMVTTVSATESNKIDDDDFNKDDMDDRPKPGTLNSKNMVSERNRRKRLSKQLLSLRALVPNITKFEICVIQIDKRSVLVDAQSYLKNIHEEIERLQKELIEQQPRPKLIDLRESSQDNPSGTLRIPRTTSTSVAYHKPKTQIREVILFFFFLSFVLLFKNGTSS